MKQLRKYQRDFIFCFLSGIVIYLLMIANELVNTYDGLWNGFYRPIFKWEISIGRWLWPVADGLRLFVSVDPITSMISIAIYALADVIIMQMLFKQSKKIIRYLSLALLIINTGVCVQLSYRFNAIAFALAYLFAVISAYFLQQAIYKSDKKIRNILLSLITGACTMGLYQATLGVTCLLVIMIIIQDILSDTSYKEIIKSIILAILMIGISCILYKLIWNGVLSVFHIKAASYNGANSLNIGTMIKSLPSRLGFTYSTFVDYFTKQTLHNLYNTYNIPFIILMILLAYAVIISFIKTRSILKTLIIAILLACIPPATNVALLLAVKAGAMIQMSIPMALVIPTILCFIDLSDYKMIQKVLLVLVCIILFGNAMQVSIDQHTMLEGRMTSLNMLNRVVSDLPEDADQYKIVFVGNPADNPAFKKDDIWNKANAYAQYGNFYLPSNGIVNSYKGLLREAGINLKLERNISLYHQICKRKDVRSMPLYPHKNSIKKINHHYVIRIS